MFEHISAEQLKAWVAGELTDEQSATIEEHLESCDDCAAAISNLDQTDLFEQQIGAMGRGENALSNRTVNGQNDSTPFATALECEGSVVGPYKLLQLIGEGGMGSVWMAEQHSPMRRTVALKITKAGMDTKEVIARFESERQALALMDHPNIARVLDAGTTNTGRPYFVMEMVRGIPITEYCDQNRLPPAERLKLFCDLCYAVQHAHRKGVIHRDLKPSNVLITLDDARPLVKVIDFGLAKATGARLTEKTLFTTMGQMVGTPAYMSPEQAGLSGLDVDTRTDVYALGVILYELLTGVTPFDLARLMDAGFAEMQRIIREDDPPTPSTRLSTLDGDSSMVARQRAMDHRDLMYLLRGDLDVIIMKALEKDRSRRYESPKEFAEDVQRYLDHEPIVARPPSIGYRLKRSWQRNKLVFIATTLIAASLLIGAVVSTMMAFRARAAEGLANDRLTDVLKEQKKTADALTKVREEQEKTRIALAASETAREQAEAAHRESEEARAEAETARQDSEEVTKLLSQVFRSPDPKREGSSVTIAEMLDQAVERLQKLSSQPGRQARLREAIAGTYESLLLPKRSVDLREANYEFWMATRGDDHIGTINAKIALANVFNNVGQKDKSLVLNRELMDQVLKKYGPESRLAMIVRNNLASNTNGQEKLTLREENVAIASRVLDSKDPALLKYKDNLAILYSESGQLPKAIELREEVLRLRREVLGPKDPKTLFTIRGLLLYYRTAKMTAKELPLAKENLTLTLETLGPEHPYTLTAMGRVAGAMEQIGKPTEALEIREEILNRKRRIFGVNSSPAIYTERVVIRKYGTFGELNRCRELGVSAVQRLRRDLGESDTKTLEMMNVVAFFLCVTPGADDEALQIARDYARHITAASPGKPTYWNTMAQVHYRREEWQEAEVALSKSMKLDKQGGATEDRFLQAMLQWQQGRKEEARESLKAASEWYDEHPGSQIWPDLLEQEATELIGHGN